MGKKEYVSITKLCPHVKVPISDECYNVKLGSQDIINVMKYCGNDFEACDVYRSHYREKKGLNSCQMSHF